MYENVNFQHKKASLSSRASQDPWCQSNPSDLPSTMSGNSRSREFPGIPASNSRPESREWNLPLAFPFPKMGMEFSICIPVPVNGNEIFLGFPGNFPGIPGNFPFPKVGNGIFYLFAFPFPKMGMEFAIHIHIPVPENGNGICHFPFPFPKSKSHSRSWLLKSAQKMR